MPENKGKPSGPDAEDKSSAGRKQNYKRFGWPEDAPTQRVENAEGQQQGMQRKDNDVPQMGEGRNQKAGSPK